MTVSLLAGSLIARLILQQAEAVQLKGRVDAASKGGSFAAVTAGQAFEEGTRIKTGEDGAITVKLHDGSRLELRGRSSMVISKVAQEPGQRSAVVLFFGKLWSKVAPQRKTDFEIITPTAVAGVRGTEFVTVAADDGDSAVYVSEGKVGVDNEKKKVDVTAGTSTEAGSDSVSTPKKQGKEPEWKGYEKEHREKLLKNGEQVAKGMKERIDERSAEASRLAERQRVLKEELKGEPSQSRKDEIMAELRKNAARLQQIGARVDGQVGAWEHWGELAEDPAYADRFYGSGFIKGELGKLRELKASLDRMVAEGTDLSMKGMEKMMDDMRDLKPTIKDKKGSAGDELFDSKP